MTRLIGKSLDVITIGRSSVDLYGQQVGGRLEDMASFNKFIGASPTNIACGAARLGLRVGLVTKVGDEHMGRFIREQLEKEGVDLRGVKTDPERLTALAMLGIRDDTTFPLIFFRENCADMWLVESDIYPELMADCRAVVATGTHLSHSQTAAAVLRALSLAKQAGARLALDIDYRPNLWGVAGHGEGEKRFVADGSVTAKLQSALDQFDLIVGTEEEFHIAGGNTDTLVALRNVRRVTNAILVCKRGAAGAVVIDGMIPDDLDRALSAPGFPVEVFNVLGAGDGFFAGLLKGWMADESWEETLRYANACGALAVSRHGCTPAYPTVAELDFFLKRGVVRPDVRNDQHIEQLHWSQTRPGVWPDLRVFAFDHRSQLEELPGYSKEKGAAFKDLCLKATLAVQRGRPGYGIFCDDRIGRRALHAASDTDLWFARPCELPGSRPLELEPELGPDCGGLQEWARRTVVKVRCFCHPEDQSELQASQEEMVQRLYTAARRNGLEFLLEIVASSVAPVDSESVANLIQRFYGRGVYPDWWKLEPSASTSAWQSICNAIEQNDPYCRGIVVLGLNATEAELAASFDVAARFDLVKGFAVGRSIFGETASAWMLGESTDDEAIAEMAKRFESLCAIWDRSRNKAAAVVSAIAAPT